MWTPRTLIITHVFFKKKRCWRSKTKIRNSKNAYNYWRVWTMLMITRVEERWRTFSFWVHVWRGLQQDVDPQAMRDEHDVLRKVDFPCSLSNILKSTESRMWMALQTWDKNEGRQREAKPTYPNELVRFTARTPWFVPHLFGEWTKTKCFYNKIEAAT